MTGQGSPNSGSARSRAVFPKTWLGFSVVCCALVALIVSLIGRPAHAQVAREIDLNLRLRWVGSEARTWIGKVYLSDGRLSDLRLLESEPEEPGSYVLPRPEPHQQWPNASPDLGARQVFVAPRSPSKRSGFDIRVRSTLNAELTIALTPEMDDASASIITIPLRDVISRSYQSDLNNGYKLQVERVPGDEVRIETQRDSMVFHAGETMLLRAYPYEVNAKAGATLRARYRIRKADTANFFKSFIEDDAVWSDESTLQLDNFGRATSAPIVEVPIPSSAGVYNLSIDFAQPLPKGSVAKRVVQFIVDGQSPFAVGGPSTLVSRFNPAEPKWDEQLRQFTRIPTSRGPWGSRNPSVWNHAGSRWTRMNGRDWMAYSLHVRRPGIPHIVDIEFPPGLAQDVSVSVLEPTLSRGDLVHGVHSGIAVGDPDIQLTAEQGQHPHHRLLFWPKSSAPVLLISNRSKNTSAAFGSIRLEAYPQGLPAAKWRDTAVAASESQPLEIAPLNDALSELPVMDSQPNDAHRQRIAVLHIQQLKTLFAPASSSNRTNQLEDWHTFEVIAARLVAYLRFAGYDGIALAAASKGSTLYPSQLLHPTPEYDRGVASSSAVDPHRKDVLEYFFRIFDREGLSLIPVVEFATPLPELERLLLPEATREGIELVDLLGQRGASLKKGHAAPYYNPLDDRVQDAMQRVLQELSGRYRHHASFAGIRVNCVGRGYSHLPSVRWGFDQRTMKSFHESLTSNPRQGLVPADSAAITTSELRAQIRASEKDPNQKSQLLDAWIEWRSQQLTALYAKLTNAVVADSVLFDLSKRTDPLGLEPIELGITKPIDLPKRSRRLYVSLSGLVDSVPWQRQLRPNLSDEIGIASTMQELGLDVSELRGIPQLKLMRPQPQGTLSNLVSQGINMALAKNDVQTFFAGGDPVADIDHQAETLQLSAFGLLPGVSGTARSTTHAMSWGDDRLRRPYAKSLAGFDDTVIFDGGENIALGQEGNARQFFDIYRQLPSVPFEPLELPHASPLVLRQAKIAETTYVYAVNPSPWQAQASLQWTTSEDADEEIQVVGVKDFRSTKLFGRQDIDLLLRPYGLVLFKVDSSEIKLLGCRAELPNGIQERLRVQLRDANLRRASLERPSTSSSRVADPGFELPLSSEGDSAWLAQIQSDGNGMVALDPNQPAEGSSSLYLRAESDSVSATSRWFEAPDTGRATISFQIRSSAATKNPLLMVRLLSKDTEYNATRIVTTPLNSSFQRVEVSFLDLPPNTEALELKFEMIDRGEVWIDEILFDDISFSAKEQKELLRILYKEYQVLEDREQPIADLVPIYDALTGYWPRFLIRYVKPVQVASRPRAATQRPVPKKSPTPKFMDRLRKYVPRVPTFRVR